MTNIKCPKCGSRVFRDKMEPHGHMELVIDLDERTVKGDEPILEQSEGNYHCEDCDYEVKWNSDSDRELFVAISKIRDTY